jgi:2-phosphoglycerate kinase
VTERGWDVLLVGGPSGAGKSSLAYPLARELGVPVLEIDDIVCALQAVTTPEQQPELFYWRTHPEALDAPVDEIMRQGIALTAALEPALAAVVGNHLETDMPVVIEGDFLRPSFTIQSGYAGQPAGTRVRGIFVLEDDPSQIVANYAAREPDAGEQKARAEVSVAWSRWLAEEAQRHDVPAIASRPWTDLIARAHALLGGG